MTNANHSNFKCQTTNGNKTKIINNVTDTMFNKTLYKTSLYFFPHFSLVHTNKLDSL